MRVTVRNLDDRVERLEWLAAWHARGMWVAAASAVTAMVTAGLIFQQTRLATRQAELQASVVDTDLRVHVTTDPDERRPVLFVKVANHGAAVSISGVALDLGEVEGRQETWRPREARRLFDRPVRLARNDAIDFEITPTHARELPPRLRAQVRGVIVELETGVVERTASATVERFFQEQ